MADHIDLEPIGTVLYEEFIEPNNLTVERVAEAISIPAWRMAAVVENGVPMTAEMDLLLTKFFGMSQGFFLRWQQHYDQRLAKRRLRKKLAGIIPYTELNKAAVL